MESRTFLFFFSSKICCVFLLNLFPFRRHLQLRCQAKASTWSVEHCPWSFLPYEKHCNSHSWQLRSLPPQFAESQVLFVSNKQRNTCSKGLLYSNPRARSLYSANKSKLVTSIRLKLLFDANLENRTCSASPQGERYNQLKKKKKKKFY